jgi:hypothetical protein
MLKSAIKFGIYALLVGFVFCFVIAVINNFNQLGGPRTSPSNACINNLRQIDGAKNEWTLEHNATNGEAVMMNQLTNYLLHGIIPKCPSGGTYTIGKVGELPACSLGTNVTPAHVLQ